MTNFWIDTDIGGDIDVKKKILVKTKNKIGCTQFNLMEIIIRRKSIVG